MPSEPLTTARVAAIVIAKGLRWDREDAASELLLLITERGLQFEDTAHLNGWIRSAFKFHYLKLRRLREISFSSMTSEEDDERFMNIMLGRQRAMQHINVEAMEARTMLDALPANQREALLILADGGNPVDVAKELKLTLGDAMMLVKDARHNIWLVDDGKWDEAA